MAKNIVTIEGEVNVTWDLGIPAPAADAPASKAWGLTRAIMDVVEHCQGQAVTGVTPEVARELLVKAGVVLDRRHQLESLAQSQKFIESLGDPIDVTVAQEILGVKTAPVFAPEVTEAPKPDVPEIGGEA